MATPMYTNKVENLADSEEWKLLPSASDPSAVAEFPKGATEPTTSFPGAQEGDMEMQPAQVPADPRLGMNPQGGWTQEKIGAMFPGMTGSDTSTWLDPAEEAKKREGLPYDATKRYDEKKPVAGYTPPGSGGAAAPQGPPTRTQFEEAFFRQHGNPFMMDPYSEVVKADASLPELFNHVFQGQAVWSDLPRLSKEQRAYWEDIKKQHHERTYKAAVGKRDQLKGMYDMMMTRFDHEEKTRQYEEGKLEKEQIRAAAKADKTHDFSLHEAFNDQGLKTWQKFYKDGRIEDTGKQTSAMTLEDYMTPQMKYKASEIKRLRPPMPKELGLALGLMKDPAERERLTSMFQPKLSDAEKATVDQYEKDLKAWVDGDKNIPANLKPQGSSPQPAAKDTSTKKQDIGALVYMSQQKNPNFPQAMAVFEQKYKNDPTAIAERNQSLARVVVSSPIVGAPTETAPETPAIVPTPAPAAVPAPVPKRNTAYELPPTTGPLDAAKFVGNLDWKSPGALVKDVAGKISPAPAAPIPPGLKLGKIPPDELIKMIVAARDSGDPEFENLLKRAKAIHAGTRVWTRLAAALEKPTQIASGD